MSVPADRALIGVDTGGTFTDVTLYDPANGRLPEYHVFLGHEDFWFTDRASRDAFIAGKEKELGHELRVATGPSVNVATRPEAGAATVAPPPHQASGERYASGLWASA